MLNVPDTETVLRSTSAAVQRWLAFGDEVDVIPGEESITDIVLTVLARVPDRRCRVVRLSRGDENKVGPDFVLWLVSNRGGQLMGLPVLIQAKRLYPSGRFETLYKGEATHPQMSVLLTVAERWGIPALYALYQPARASLGGGGHHLPSKCTQIDAACAHGGGKIIPPLHPGWCPLRDEADLGVALAAATAVKAAVEAIGSRPAMTDISPLAVPLACLATCACAPPLIVAPAPPSSPPPGPDLVDVALSRLRTLDDGLDLSPRPFPDWLQDVMASGPSAAELRNITRQDVTDDVGTVLVISDTDLDAN